MFPTTIPPEQCVIFSVFMLMTMNWNISSQMANKEMSHFFERKIYGKARIWTWVSCKAVQHPNWGSYCAGEEEAWALGILWEMFLSCNSLFHSAAAFLTLQLPNINWLSKKYHCELVNKHSYHLHTNRGPLAEENPFVLLQDLNYLLW